MATARASGGGWRVIVVTNVLVSFACTSTENAGDGDDDPGGGRSGAMATSGSNAGGSAGVTSGGGGAVGATAGMGVGVSGSGGSGGSEGGSAGVSAGASSSGMAGMPGGAGVGGAQGGSDGGGAGGAVIGGAAGTPTCRDETFESKTYLVCPNAGLDRAAARTFCQGRSADLVKIDSAAEDLWAYETVTEPGSIWIGANDIEQEGDWRWTDGSSVMAGYVAWATGQPNDSGGAEDCAVLHSGMGEWNDVACTVTAFGSDPMTVVCEP